MAFAGPTYVGVSTGNGSASAATIDFTSSGRSAGDLLFIAVMTANQAVTISGWTEVATYSPQSRGTAGAADYSRTGNNGRERKEKRERR